MEPDKKVEVSQSDLKALMDQVALLTKQVQEQGRSNPEHGGLRILRPITERQVKVFFIDDKPVIGYANKGTETRPVHIYSKVDPNDKNHRIEYADIIVQGGKEPITLEHKDFLENAVWKWCKVVKTDVTPWVIDQGTIRKKYFDGKSTVETDVLVPLEVIGETRVFTVELEDGKTAMIPERYVNLA